LQTWSHRIYLIYPDEEQRQLGGDAPRRRGGGDLRDVARRPRCVVHEASGTTRAATCGVRSGLPAWPAAPSDGP